jgi:hypothetical protein
LHENSYQNFIQIHSNIHRIHVTVLLLEKIKRNSFSSDFGPKVLARPRFPQARGPLKRPSSQPPEQSRRPGRNLGLGQKSCPVRSPTWATFSPSGFWPISTIHLHPTATSESRKIKTC